MTARHARPLCTHVNTYIHTFSNGRTAPVTAARHTVSSGTVNFACRRYVVAVRSLLSPSHIVICCCRKTNSKLGRGRAGAAPLVRSIMLNVDATRKPIGSLPPPREQVAGPRSAYAGWPATIETDRDQILLSGAQILSHNCMCTRWRDDERFEWRVDWYNNIRRE
jgi:hypothetical protein